MYIYCSHDKISTKKFKFSINVYNIQIPTIVEDKLVQGYELLKVLTYPYLYVKKTGLTNEMNKVTAYLKIIPTHKKVRPSALFA